MAKIARWIVQAESTVALGESTDEPRLEHGDRG